MYYVQIDNKNIVIGLSDLSGEVAAANLVHVPVYDLDYLGRTYDRESGTFGERQPVEPVEQPPTEMEVLTAKVDYISMVVEGLVLNV